MSLQHAINIWICSVQAHGCMPDQNSYRQHAQSLRQLRVDWRGAGGRPPSTAQKRSQERTRRSQERSHRNKRRSYGLWLSSEGARTPEMMSQQMSLNPARAQAQSHRDTFGSKILRLRLDGSNCAQAAHYAATAAAHVKLRPWTR